MRKMTLSYSNFYDSFFFDDEAVARRRGASLASKLGVNEAEHLVFRPDALVADALTVLASHESLSLGCFGGMAAEGHYRPLSARRREVRLLQCILRLVLSDGISPVTSVSPPPADRLIW
jgi:hypothetical protein